LETLSINKYIAFSSHSLIIGLFLLLFSGFVNASHPDSALTRSPENGEDSPYKVREFELTEPGLLTVFTMAGDISVEVVPNSTTARVELYVDRGFAFWSGSKNLDNYRINMIKRGNEIIASVEQKSNEKGIFDEQMKFSFKVFVPEQVSSQLKTAGGDISIQGIRGSHTLKTSGGSIKIAAITGKIEAYTSGGNIQVERSTGTIFALTDGGNVTLNDSGGELRVKTKGGVVTANRVVGSMLASVDGGDIYAQFNSIAHGVNFETTAGNITLLAPHHDGYDLSLTGTQINIPTTSSFSGSKSSKQVTGSINGGGKTIVLTTTYGTINLNLTGQQ
jgi:DUF4097 and DUF4098 domain-containing protein YvlB